MSREKGSGHGSFIAFKKQKPSEMCVCVGCQNYDASCLMPVKSLKTDDFINGGGSTFA